MTENLPKVISEEKASGPKQDERSQCCGETHQAQSGVHCPQVEFNSVMDPELLQVKLEIQA